MDDPVTNERVVDELLEAVARRTPVDERERDSIAEFVAAVERLRAIGADPFDQRDDPVHVTGSGVVVGRRGVVLLQHKRLGIWLQPGGHIDPGETPWEAAQRETVEETGLDVEFIDPADRQLLAVAAGAAPPVLHVDVHAGGRGHTHLDVRYLFGGDDADPSPPPGESQQIGWFDWPTAIARADPGLAGLLRSMSSS